MSRVHDALRRAEQVSSTAEGVSEAAAPNERPNVTTAVAPPPPPPQAHQHAPSGRSIRLDLLSHIKEVPFTPSVDSHLIDMSKPHEAPSEEFRTLRTRLNHLQTLQPISTLVVTSPSPAEGKSFAAVNLALAEAQLANNPTLLIDCDFRRPIAHSLFQIERTPGMTDYLLGKCKLEDAIRKIAGTGFT